MSAFDVLAVSAVLQLIPLSDPPSKVVTASDWASVISAMTSQISVSTVVGVLATLVTAPDVFLCELSSFPFLFALAVWPGLLARPFFIELLLWGGWGPRPLRVATL